MIYKRNRTYWYEFQWNGQRIRESTRQGNQNVARDIESAHRTSLAKGEVGLRDKTPAPTLRQFAEGRFTTHVNATFDKKPKTKSYYLHGVKFLCKYEPLAKAPLDEITAELVTEFVQQRQAKKRKVSAINRELEVLRRIMKLALEWDEKRVIFDHVPISIKMLPGEKKRERVVTPEEERKYFLACKPLLRDVATILLDAALRPEECFRMRREDNQDGVIQVQHGKTEAARRRIPMTPRVRAIVERRLSEHQSEWVFPAPTESGHIEPSSSKAQQKLAIKNSEVKPFPLYSLRHTCLTRWAPHMDPFTLAYLAGHSSMKSTKRYVHPEDATVRAAMDRVATPPKSHHSVQSIISDGAADSAATPSIQVSK